MVARRVTRSFQFLFLTIVLVYSALIVIRFIIEDQYSSKRNLAAGSDAAEQNHYTEESIFRPIFTRTTIRPSGFLEHYYYMEELSSLKHLNGADHGNISHMRFPLPLCPEKSPYLIGNMTFNLTDIKFPEELSVENGGTVEFGGWWRPQDCHARAKVAFLIPYRKRPEQLNIFLNHMHPLFQRQQLDYRVFVVEQAGNSSFNKGAIYNIGFNLSREYDDYECYVFHDVDLLSENDMNFYGCPTSPMHMSVGIDKFNYKLSYPTLIGGIQAFWKKHYVDLNGYSNKFWGWGGEDDNLFTRLKAKGLKIHRPSVDIARYKMNKRHHHRSDPWSQANHYMLFQRRPRQFLDGLNSINTLKFTLEKRNELLYTIFSINLTK